MDEKEQRIEKEQTIEQTIDKQELMLLLNDVEKKLTDLKARWPFHSVQPKMVAEREDLEEERERLLGLLTPA
ncbi:hypothetical protein [Desulfosporosinus sp. BICA1-9]|uniref:hypothetical protein n=1 Tax=Desulfosporosinus sp. BICA1-9 TaxID=1531958 RepID=UPI00054B8340|nr:hypothetical protein [Desulfosporosinus sp. BICA1-9]KJS47995.1 MAG: hypothetical protein VR66_16315 [Peptococcaceae bacterium BRH_c23]KJS82005.1 MAG: hypothetical protein JL57_25175 [Desulfosporosinus sp. BICA1-9]